MIRARPCEDCGDLLWCEEVICDACRADLKCFQCPERATHIASGFDPDGEPYQCDTCPACVGILREYALVSGHGFLALPIRTRRR